MPAEGLQGTRVEGVATHGWQERTAGHTMAGEGFAINSMLLSPVASIKGKTVWWAYAAAAGIIRSSLARQRPGAMAWAPSSAPSPSPHRGDCYHQRFPGLQAHAAGKECARQRTQICGAELLQGQKQVASAFAQIFKAGSGQQHHWVPNPACPPARTASTGCDKRSASARLLPQPRPAWHAA